MSTAKDKLRAEFRDFQARHDYVEIFLHSSIALQIKALRLQRGWSQKQLAELTGMKQSRISAMEQASYTGRSVATLLRLAKAFDVALLLRFESFGKLLDEVFDASLEPESFADDPAARVRQPPPVAVSSPRQKRGFPR